MLNRCMTWMAAAALAAGTGITVTQAEEQPVAVPGKVAKIAEAKQNITEIKAKLSEVDNYDYVDKPLKVVLDFLSTKSGLNIRCLNDKEEKLLVTLHLENVTYRAVLDFVAKKYGLSVDDTRLKEKLIFVSSPEKISIILKDADIRKVIDIIAAQTEANIVIGPEVTGKISLNLNNVPWLEALNIIVKTLDFVAVQEANDTIRITSPAKLQTNLETRIFNLSYLTPEGTKYSATIDSIYAQKTTDTSGSGFKTAGKTLVEMLASIKSEKGTIVLVNKTNAIVATDTPPKLDMMEEIINKLDIAPKQVQISVKIVDITDNDMERLGIDWGTTGLSIGLEPLTNIPTAFPFDSSKGLSKSLLGKLAVGFGFAEGGNPDYVSLGKAVDTRYFNPTSRVINAANASSIKLPYEAEPFSSSGPIHLGKINISSKPVLELLSRITNARIIQSPYIVTLDNEEATIQVGLLYRYAEQVTITTEGGGSSQGFKEASGSPIKLGTQLLVIPHVTGPENNVLLTVIPKTEELVDEKHFIGPSGTDLVLPETTQKIVVSRMMLRNGETGVIGGLRSEKETKVETKIPILGDIPFLGRLFKHKSLNLPTDGKSSVQVFVTPTIVDIDQKVDFKTQLETLKSSLSAPFAPLGDEEDDKTSPKK